jgi:hypothetical protein
MASSEDYDDGGLYTRAIRALGGVRDWWNTPRPPTRFERLRGGMDPFEPPGGDVNLPVTPPVKEPFSIPTPEKIGQAVGGKLRSAGQKIAKNVGDYTEHLRNEFRGTQDVGDVASVLGEDIKTGYESLPQSTRDKLGKASGVLGASTESIGRAGGAYLDVIDPRNTGSEKKPMSDVAWEGLKGVKSGYEKGAFHASDLGQETLKRTGSTGSKILDAQIQLALGSVDALGLIPAGAVLGAGADVAHGVMGGWLPPNLWKKVRGVEGFTHQLNYDSDAEKILKTGFGTHSGEDVIERMGHAGYYTPAQAKAARASGKAPTGQSNQSYSYGNQLPLDFPETTKVLDVRMAPVPREDIDVILSRLDPVKDKKYIQDIEHAWEAQRPYAEAVPHADVRSGKIKPAVLAAHYKTLEADPVAKKAIEDLNSLLSYPSHSDVGYVGTVHGIGGVPGKTGTSALNHPSMPMEYGAIHYTDYVAGNGYGKQGSIAFDPRQTLTAPVGSTLDPKKTPWQTMGLAPAGTPKGDYGSSYFKGIIPSDAPGGVSAPLPGQAPGLPVVQPPPTSQEAQALKWAEENLNPPKIKPKKPKVYPAEGPTYGGQPISTYEQGTLKELEAAGRPLDKVQTKKLAAIKQYESGRLPVEAPTAVIPEPSNSYIGDMLNAAQKGDNPENIQGSWGMLLGSEQVEFSQNYPDLYEKIKPIIFSAPEVAGQPASSHWASFGATTPPSAGTFAANLKNGGTYDEIIEAYNKMSPGGKEDFQDFFTNEYDLFQNIVKANEPVSAPKNPEAALYQPQTHRVMQQHATDLKSIWEQYGIPPAWGNNLDEFFNAAIHPDLSPHDLHMAAVDWANQSGNPGAAEEIKELWEMKKTAIDDGTELAPGPALTNFIDDVEPVVEKVDVFDPGSGKSFGTFDSQAEADAFINSHPQRQFLDSAPHDPMYMAGETEFPSAVQGENLDVAGVNFDALMKGATRPAPTATPNLVKKPTAEDILSTRGSGPEWDDFVDQGGIEAATQDMSQIGKLEPVQSPIESMGGKAPSKGAKKLAKTAGSDAAWLQKSVKQLREMQAQGMKLPPVALDKIAAFDAKKAGKLGKAPIPSKYDQDIAELDKLFGTEPIPEPSPLNPMGKESIGVLDAEGSLDYLKNTYPEVAENFGKHSGTEMGSIESHTKDVLKQWKTQLTPQEFQDISQRSGIDVEALMNVALPLHDIGKPQAIAAGDKTMQHSHTVPIMRDILQKEGFDPEDIELATELFNHDMIGGLLQGSSKYTPQQVADELVKKAEKVGLDPSDFAKLQLAFFQADASSYPFVTQYMKQQPNGGWISGSPKVKPIEDLIQGPTNIKSAAPAVDNTYKIKVPDAEDLLGGTKSKSIYTKGGQDYLFKEANPPYFADQEVSANKIANLSGLHPIKIEKMEMGGKPGTMQAAVGNNMNWPTLKEVDLTTLTSEELRDIIRNHPVDWLTGNMDAHGAQFLRTPNGIVEIDRGRAFKSYQGNKLHEDYNPQGGPGFYDQVYNDMIKLYKKGKLPQLTEGDISSALEQTIFKMNQNQIPIMQEIHAGLDRSKQGHLDTLANTRMANLRKDMMKFWLNK